MTESSLQSALDTLSRGAADIISRDELLEKLRLAAREKRPLKVKLGLDPTAPDIHLGFAVVLRKLRVFQDLGHEAHLIIGDFTAQIGDPSGKSKTRPQLTREQVQANAETYKQQLFKILDETKTTVHFNGDWLGQMSFVDVVRLASQTTVSQMIEREDFAKRLASHQPLGLHELLYPLCQGQDSVEIRADVELGGSDQRFNNLVGRELQKHNDQAPQVVMLMPILVGLDGTQKMSKSLGNYIGISEAPGEMFGKVMSLSDEPMRSYFTLCTEVSIEEIDEILAGHPMEAKKRLAREIVAQFHGAQAAQNAQDAWVKQFSRGDVPDEMPEIPFDESELGVAEVLKRCFEISLSEARRMVSQGAVSIDERKIEDANSRIELLDGMILKMGKRRFARVRLGSG